ncbi:hypothetical protein HDV05_006581, partial [Chytridiales sp. JEL 0842]
MLLSQVDELFESATNNNYNNSNTSSVVSESWTTFRDSTSSSLSSPALSVSSFKSKRKSICMDASTDFPDRYTLLKKRHSIASISSSSFDETSSTGCWSPQSLVGSPAAIPSSPAVFGLDSPLIAPLLAIGDLELDSLLPFADITEEDQQPNPLTPLPLPAHLIVPSTTTTTPTTPTTPRRLSLPTTTTPTSTARPLPCPHQGCPKTFSRPYNLQTHLISHTGE